MVNNRCFLYRNIGVLHMKHISHYLAIFCILNVSVVNADHHNLHQSVMQQTSQGGAVTIDGQTFQTEPGQSVVIQGGGVTTHTRTTQVDDEPPVTVTEVVKRPLTVTVDGPSIHSTSLSTQDELTENERKGIVRRTGQVAVQTAEDAADVAVQTTEGVVDTIGNFFSGLFGR